MSDGSGGGTGVSPQIRLALQAPALLRGALGLLSATRAQRALYQSQCANLVSRGQVMDDTLALALRFIKGNANKSKAQVIAEIEAARRQWQTR